MFEIVTEIDIVNNIINDISHNIENQNFDHINQNEIINLSETNILILINNIICIIRNNNYHKYKFSHYENTINLIINIIIKSYNNNKKIDLSFNDFIILKIISSVNNSHIYLKKIKNIIKINNYYNINLLYDIALKSSMPVFLFWWNTFYKNIVSSNINILINAILNPDDRIYKFLLEEQKINIVDKENKLIIVNNLFSSPIPRKYIQKRLKILSFKIDFSEIVNEMITGTNDIKLKNTILTYYYKSKLHFNTLINIVTNCAFNFTCAISIYETLKSQEEKEIFILICNLTGYYHEKLYITNITSKILDDNKEYIICKLLFQLNIIYEYSIFSEGLNKILKYYKTNNLLNEYIIKYHENFNSIFLIKYTKFFVLPNNSKTLWLSTNIKINKCLHFLRCVLKKYSNNKYNQFNYKFKPIINEIKNFKPNNKIKILNNGSLNYQLNCQKFNNIPPRHLLPLENILHRKFLIKEKADGILTSILPNKIIPYVNDIYNYEIKAEFIEELNLYLIFDINIPNTTIIERQNYLRSIHPETSYLSDTIINFEILINEIKKERIIFNNFINKNKNNNSDFKWYPKGSWKVLMNENIYTNLINIIEENNEVCDIILNGEFKCDGLILTPLDGTRELKIKPKKLQTIDLLFNGVKWLDSDNKEWNIDTILNKIYKNKIYRCYPINNKYIAIEIRFDKHKPNSTKIINQIQNIYKFNWLDNINLLVNNEKYYEMKQNINDNHLINILNYQKNLLNNMIIKINPEINKNWLDLGCGKCKLYYLIKNNYIPKKYLGIDNDINILSSKYNIIDTNNNISLYPCNLNIKWDDINIWNNFDWSIKYDYIIANFSIMHFCSELFWEQLNRITKIGSIFIFNIVKENINWNYNQSYIKSNNNETKMYFEWVHTKEHIEIILSKDKINYFLKKYNWKIKNLLSDSNNELSNCYIWYNIIKQ